MSWEGFFASLDRMRSCLRDFAGGSPESHCRLHTADGKDILVADNASMVSLLRVRGTIRLMGEEEYLNACDMLTAVLSTPLAGQGHALQAVFSCDPGAAAGELEDSMRPLRQAAAALAPGLDSVLSDWARVLASYCAAESLYLAVWTTPALLSRAARKQAFKARRAEGSPRLRAKEAQTALSVLDELRDAHRAVTRELRERLASLSFQAETLETHEAVRVLRSQICPDWTSGSWRPVLPGDPLPLRAPEPGSPVLEATSFAAPSIARQIWPQPAIVREGRFVEVDGRLYAPFVMSMPPQNPLPFSALFKALLSENLPWRAAMLLTGDGMRGQGLKSAAASVLSFASSSNKMLQQSYAQLRELALNGAVCVGLQISFATWVSLDGQESYAQARSELCRRAARLAATVQSWGACDTAMLTGDPLFAFTASLPAMTLASPAVKALAPLSDAVRLLPFFRPCSPWTAMDVPLRTPDGRLMPVGLFSPNMASWNEICFAGMGAGKSFFLNTLNLFFLIRAGQERLPWLTVIDIGASCSGVIELVRAALPPDKKYLAVFARLRNSRSAAVNPFDTLLGVAKPLQNHASFLVNLLSLLCTPLSETAPGDGVTDLLTEALDSVYRRLAPDGEEPRLYESYPEPELAARLGELDLVPDRDATWWEVSRQLFEHGYVELAERAQRHAVPLLADLMVELNNPLFKDRFGGIHARGSAESLTSACVRHLTTAIRDYPLLAAPTCFSLGSARVVGLDLTEVTPRGGPAAERQSGVMYLLARFVGASRFFNTMDDLEAVPDWCREYHRKRFEDLVALPKRLCYDEFHRASCQDLNNPLSRQILSDLTTASREARKQNLAICLYSQQLSDFPKVLVDLASCVYAMGAGNAAQTDEICARFGLNEAARTALRNTTRPTRAGASFVALYRTSQGESIQHLACTAGTCARWAFTTTAEDMRVRNALYERMGCARALSLLMECYPEGTVREEIERRRQRAGSGAAVDVTEQILRELCRRAGLEEE